MQFTNIPTDETMRELCEHGTSDFPFQYYYEDIKKFDRGYIDWHWHREFEFVSVESGEVHCIIGSLKITLQQGDAIFINAGVVHRFEAPKSGVIPNILFAPEFIAPAHSRIYEKYVRTFTDSNISHAVFQSTEPWQRDVLQYLATIYNICKTKKDGWELQCLFAVEIIWSILYAHHEDFETIEKSGISLIVQNRLRLMTSYIEENYATAITLQDIAEAAAISKTEALRCFKAGFLTSPVDYLNKFRLKKAYGLLLNTEDNINTVACRVGIDNTSYFNKVFKNEYHMTPGEVRNAPDRPGQRVRQLMKLKI